MNCVDLFEHFDLTELPDVEHVSDSVVVLARPKTKPDELRAIKVFWRPNQKANQAQFDAEPNKADRADLQNQIVRDEQNYNTLQFELNVYKFISTNSKTKDSPLFVKWIYHAELAGPWCPTIIDTKFTDRPIDAEFLKRIRQLLPGHPDRRRGPGRNSPTWGPNHQVSDTGTLHAIVTEASPAYLTSVGGHISFYDHRDKIRALCFQVIYALAVLAQIQIQHNDLHLQNILLSTTSIKSARLLPVTVNDVDTIFKVPGRLGFIKLFDWNTASVAGNNNPRLTENLCRQTATCDTLNSKFDLFMFLRVVHKDIIVRQNLPVAERLEFEEFLQWVVGVPPPAQINHRLCNKSPSSTPINIICDRLTPDSYPNMKIPTEALRHAYFHPLLYVKRK